MRTELTRRVSRGLFGPALLVAAAFIVKGYTGAGDGFAAGAVVALAIILVRVAHGGGEVDAALGVRLAYPAMLAGLAILLAIALVPLALGDALLTHWPPPGEEPVKIGTLELITAVVFDVGIALLVAGALVGAASLTAGPPGEGGDR